MEEKGKEKWVTPTQREKGDKKAEMSDKERKEYLEKVKEEARDQTPDIIQAHLGNALCFIWEDEDWKEFDKILKDVAENAKGKKLTLEEYEKIVDDTLERTPEDKKDKISKGLNRLKLMIFEEEKEEE